MSNQIARKTNLTRVLTSEVRFGDTSSITTVEMPGIELTPPLACNGQYLLGFFAEYCKRHHVNSFINSSFYRNQLDKIENRTAEKLSPFENAMSWLYSVLMKTSLDDARSHYIVYREYSYVFNAGHASP